MYRSTTVTARVYSHYLIFLQHLQNIKRSIFSFLSLLSSSLVAFILLLLLVHNGFNVFYVQLPAKSYQEPANFLPENPAGKSLKKASSTVMYAVKEENPPLFLKRLLEKPATSTVSSNHSMVMGRKKVRKYKSVTGVLRLGDESKEFSTRVKGFFHNSACKGRFFMTWISSLQSFGDREFLVMESLFKSHPNACLVIVSNSMGSASGNLVLKPFLDNGLKVIAVKPDFHYLFKNTPAETWFNRLKRGNVEPGEVSLGQNLSNLVRLALLHKFGGTYLDTDVLVLRSLTKLRNVIGAQTIDLETGNWSRLNNAVLVFDKRHPLLFKFIEEFALTFDGNKWGHNGPYLVSRVVARVNGRPGFNFTVLPPPAFYPVDWVKIRSVFKGPRNELQSKWLHKKLEQIRGQSLAVHLWNKQSRKFKVENGSIIHHVLSESCIFCNISGISSLEDVDNTQRQAPLLLANSF